MLTNGVVRNVARRISITKVSRRTAAAAELIALCQTITADGRLTDAEVIALKQWLIDSERVDLPAKETDGEHDELYVYLARDPASPFSANAIEIRLSNGMQIGFVPETDARDMAPGWTQDARTETRR